MLFREVIDQTPQFPIQVLLLYCSLRILGLSLPPFLYFQLLVELGALVSYFLGHFSFVLGHVLEGFLLPDEALGSTLVLALFVLGA